MNRRKMLGRAGAGALAAVALSKPAIAQGRSRMAHGHGLAEGPARARHRRRSPGATHHRRCRTAGCRCGCSPRANWCRACRPSRRCRTAPPRWATTRPGFHLGKHRAFAYFFGPPFGMSYSEHVAWLDHGGGQALWDELSAQFGLKSFADRQHRHAAVRLVQEGDQDRSTTSRA